MLGQRQERSLSISTRRAFDAAFTRELLRELVEYAQRHLPNIGRATIAHLSAEDLVHAAIAKTLDGALQWAPARRCLAHHLRAAIDSQISHALRHAREFPLVYLDADEETEAIEAAITHADAQAHQSEQAAREAWGGVLAALEIAACGHVGVRTLLDAYGAGARTRREVIAQTGMSPREYAAAYARLLRIANRDDLPLGRAA